MKAPRSLQASTASYFNPWANTVFSNPILRSSLHRSLNPRCIFPRLPTALGMLSGKGEASYSGRTSRFRSQCLQRIACPQPLFHLPWHNDQYFRCKFLICTLRVLSNALPRLFRQSIYLCNTTGCRSRRPRHTSGHPASHMLELENRRFDRCREPCGHTDRESGPQDCIEVGCV